VGVGKNRTKLLKTLQQAYSKAPYSADVFRLIEKSLLYKDNNLANYVSYSIRIIADYLKIDTRFILSSDLEKDNDLKGQDKVLEICRILGATEYINAIGGVELYSTDEFNKNSIALYFINTKDITYEQFNHAFIPNLSIIDVLMFNPKKMAIKFLHEYELIE
jgi:putative cell wall-binding protein